MTVKAQAPKTRPTESSSRKNKLGLRSPNSTWQKPDLWKLKSKEQTRTAKAQAPKTRPMKAQVERTAADPQPSASLTWTDAKAQAPKKKPTYESSSRKNCSCPRAICLIIALTVVCCKALAPKTRATNDQGERTGAAPEHLPHWLYLAVL